MLLIGQKQNLEIIDRWKELPNFIIIQGEEHVGKTYMVLYLCKKFGLRYNKIKNGIQNVRNMVKYMGENSNMLFHFDNFDDASIQAKNALLKITEEPIRGNYIVITGNSQIKTLESRARKIVMQPYSIQDMMEYLKDSDYDTQYINTMYNAGINTPAKIEYYKDCKELQETINYSYFIFEHITFLKPDLMISIAYHFQDRYEPDKIDVCLLFLTLLIHIVETNVTSTHYYSYKKVLTLLISAKNKLVKEPTLRRRMLLFRTFYSISALNEMTGVGVDG